MHILTRLTKFFGIPNNSLQTLYTKKSINVRTINTRLIRRSTNFKKNLEQGSPQLDSNLNFYGEILLDGFYEVLNCAGCNFFYLSDYKKTKYRKPAFQTTTFKQKKLEKQIVIQTQQNFNKKHVGVFCFRVSTKPSFTWDKIEKVRNNSNFIF